MNFVFKKFKTFRTSFIETFFFNAAYEFDSFQTLGILKNIFHCQKMAHFRVMTPYLQPSGQAVVGLKLLCKRI